MDIYIDKENSFGQQRVAKKKKKGLSVRKRALQTLEETNTPLYEEISTKKSEEFVAVESQVQPNLKCTSENKIDGVKGTEIATINPSDSSASGSNSVGKFKMPDYIKNFGKGPTQRKRKKVNAFGTPKDKNLATNAPSSKVKSVEHDLVLSTEKKKLLTRLGGAKRITGSSKTSDSLHNDNTTLSVLSSLNNVGTKLEAIQEQEDKKFFDTSNGLTSQSASSNENTSSNVRTDSKHERKKASNTPSIVNKAGRVTSAKKITTPVNIKLDYIKNWKPGRPKGGKASENMQSNKSTTSTHALGAQEKKKYEARKAVRDDAMQKKDKSHDAGNTALKSHAGSNSASKNGENEGKNLMQHVVKNSDKVTKASNARANTSSGTKRQNTDVSFTTVMTPKNIVTVSGRHYMRLEQIGRGGSSKVYKVLGSDMKVYALKRIRPQRMNRKTLSIFQNEINLMVKLKGKPNIIQLIDAEINMEKKCIYMVMEMGDIDLNHLLKKRREEHAKKSIASNENFLRITWQQMLEAVHTIHQNRIVHSDLKPANFLCVKGVLKLIDFGIAKAINDDTVNIHRESQIGTINYMSPESITDTGSHSGATPFGKRKQHMKLGRSSDIWSLGCILYQMVYGKTPFAHLSLVQKLQAITNPKYEINYPDHSNPALINTIKSCLQRDRNLRPTIDGPNGLLMNEFLNPKSNVQTPQPKAAAETSSTIKGNNIDMDNMSELVDGLLDLGHRLGETKTERDKKVREKLAQELYNQIKEGKPFDLEDALDSAVSRR